MHMDKSKKNLNSVCVSSLEGTIGRQYKQFILSSWPQDEHVGEIEFTAVLYQFHTDDK